MPLIVMLMIGGSCLRLITITSVFLLFSSSPFSLLFDSTMFRSCCRSFSFSEIRTVSPAYLRLFMLCPPTRIPGCPSMFLMIIWNSHSVNTKNCDTFQSFKSHLKTDLFKKYLFYSCMLNLLKQSLQCFLPFYVTCYSFSYLRIFKILH